MKQAQKAKSKKKPAKSKSLINANLVSRFKYNEGDILEECFTRELRCNGKVKEEAFKSIEKYKVISRKLVAERQLPGISHLVYEYEVEAIKS